MWSKVSVLKCVIVQKPHGQIDNHAENSVLPQLRWREWVLKGSDWTSDVSSLSPGRSIACPIRMSLYIFLLYHIYHLCFTCIDFYDLSAWCGCWFDVYIRRFIYKFVNVCPFDYTAVAGSVKVWPVNQVNHTSWVAVVTPTDRPKSVRSRCLIELFCGVVCVFTLPFWHFRGCRDFCHRTESDLLLFVLIIWQNQKTIRT